MSRTLEQTFINLHGPVPTFEGEDIMDAGATPTANGGTTPVANGSHVDDLTMNGVEGEGATANGQAVAGQTLEVEMDMS